MVLSQRNLLTASTAALLCGAFFLYAAFVTPRIQPPLTTAPRPTASPAVESKGPVEYVQQAATHLPDDSWTADAPYKLRMENAFIYAQKWELLEDKGIIRFRPFAMIWTNIDPKRPGEAVSIVSESAVLQFESKLERANPKPGRIIGAALEGNVRITGPDGLKIVGSNLFFSESALRAWSESPVEFAFEGNRGTARGLQIDFLAMDGPPPSDRPAVGGIRSIRLRHDVRMELALDEQRGPGREKPGREKPARAPRTPVTIKSAGSFIYFVESRVATFEDHVQVSRATGPREYDWLDCDVLTLVFEPDATRVAAEEPERDPNDFRGMDANLRFRRMRAEGTRVVLTSQRNGLRAEMRELLYDDQEKVVALKDSPLVRVNHRTSRLFAPEITMVLDEHGDVQSAVCKGAGRLENRNEKTSELEFAAEWLRQLRMYPDPDSDLDVIELEQQASFRQPAGKSALGADLIRVWLTRPENGASLTNGDAGSDLKTPGNDVRPKQLLALKNVAMISPELVGQCQRLEAQFDDTPPTSTIVTDAQRPAPAAHQRRFAPPLTKGGQGEFFDRSQRPPGAILIPDVPGRPRTGLHPAVRRIPDPAAVNEQDERPESPLEVVCETIQVRLHRDPAGQKLHASEVWTRGNVSVTQHRNADQPPLRATGHQMHVQNQGEGREILLIYGTPASETAAEPQPAHIRDRDMHIQGHEIRLDRGTNQATVAGTGLLQFPTQRGLDGKPLAKPQLIDVLWNEGMQFDGQTAEFTGDVRTKLDGSTLRCELMRVVLNRMVSFADEQPEEQDLDVQSIVCRDGVELSAFVHEENQLKEIRRAQAGELTIDRGTGEMTAQGPGWLQVWSWGRGRRAALAPAAVVQANRPLAAGTTDWEYTRVDFRGRMVGHLEDRRTRFRDGVEIVYGPVVRPTDIIDPNRLPKDAGWLQCETLEVTQIEPTPEGRHIELLGEGNVKLEGKTFYGRADYVSFDQSKGLYTLWSRGDQNAMVSYQKEIGGQPEDVEARRFWLIPSQNIFKADRVSGFSGSR